MSFLNPIFLFALISVAVPLLIYLLNIRKPRRIQFSTLAFFDSLKSSSLKKIKIKRWLLLLLRCLAIIALVIAASRPFIPPGLGLTNHHEPKIIGIVIDNSPSMNQIDRDGPYFEQAVNLARELISNADNKDRFFIEVTNGESLPLPVLSASAAIAELNELEVQNSGNHTKRRLQNLSNRILDSAEPNKRAYFITDGQETQLMQINEEAAEQPIPLFLQVLKLGNSEPVNIGFGSVDIQTGGERPVIRAEIVNYGKQNARNQFLSLLIDGDLLSQQPFQLDSGSQQEFFFDLPGSKSGFIQAELLIEGDELTFDNRFYAAVQIPDQRKILVIERERSEERSFKSYLRPLFDAAGMQNNRIKIEWATLESFSLENLSNYEAVVLDGLKTLPDFFSQALIDYIQQGAGILLLPAADGSISNYNRFLGFLDGPEYRDIAGTYGSFNSIDRLAPPEAGHPVLSQIFDKESEEQIRLNAPDLFYYYIIEAAAGQRTLTFPVLKSRTGNVLLSEAEFGNGKIMLSAIGADPGWSNFPVKPLFAPLFFRVAEYLARGEGASLNVFNLEQQLQIDLPNTQSPVIIKKNNQESVPDIRQTFNGRQITYDGMGWTPGWFYVETDEQELLYSVNQRTMESELNTFSEERMVQVLSNQFEDIGFYRTGEDPDEFTRITSASFGSEIWYWFIILALGLLLLESIISRHYKAESLA